VSRDTEATHALILQIPPAGQHTVLVEIGLLAGQCAGEDRRLAAAGLRWERVGLNEPTRIVDLAEYRGAARVPVLGGERRDMAGGQVRTSRAIQAEMCADPSGSERRPKSKSEHAHLKHDRALRGRSPRRADQD
jgi:hypothetical protein